jgi:hypothetical protein
LERNLSKVPLGRHLGDLKSKDFSASGFHRKGDTEGLALAVFGGLQVIELNLRDRRPSERAKPAFIFNACLSGKKPKLPDHCLPVHAKQDGSPPLGDARVEEQFDGVVELSFLLSIAVKQSP